MSSFSWSSLRREALLVVVLLFLLDRGVGWLVLPLFEPSRPVTRSGTVDVAHAYGHLRAAVLSPADVLVMGSSRSLAHYDDKLLSERLKTRVFNAGSPGMGLLEARATYSFARRARPIRAIFFDVVYIPLEEKMIYRLEPWLGQDPIVDALLKGNWREQLKSRSCAYRCGDSLFDLAYDYGKAPPDFAFAPREGTVDPGAPLPTFTQGFTGQIPGAFIASLNAFIDETRAGNTRLVFVESPTMRSGPLLESVTGVYARVARERNVPFLRLGSSTVDLFSDAEHLNAKGARLFSERLAERTLELRLLP